MEEGPGARSASLFSVQPTLGNAPVNKGKGDRARKRTQTTLALARTTFTSRPGSKRNRCEEESIAGEPKTCGLAGEQR